jgi:thioredoxin reductase (NADPH)
MSTIDCLIVGGGPAGLTAGLYLARFRRNVRLVDAGASRAAQIPKSHNHPGFAGISGEVLLAAMHKQAERYGVVLERGVVSKLAISADGFVAQTAEHEIHAARILIAAGIVDAAPNLPGLERAVAEAAVRYCPICDAYEAADNSLAVFGNLADASGKALFLRSYTRRVTVLLSGSGPRDELTMQELHEAGIKVVTDPLSRFVKKDNGIGVILAGGEQLEFDVLYPALGCAVNSDLARALGAKHTAAGFLVVDDKQQTSVPGLFAAGDVVSDLHQISVAEGHAAIAATAIHNDLPRNFR